ncbi:hypothetical protein QZH41_000334 [Actinostola sp. cb2023]|nr:hypothetical protein QZH41_000334 [Actinostola sp. cb2023]
MSFLRRYSFRIGVPFVIDRKHTIHHKMSTQGPSTTLEFMGITLDSVRMEARLPPDKLERILTTLSEFQDGPISQAGPLGRPITQASSSSTPGDLNADILRYLNLSIAASTKQTYSSGIKIE